MRFSRIIVDSELKYEEYQNKGSLIGQGPNDNAFQKAYMVAPFASLTNGQKFVHNINGNPNFPWKNKLLLPSYSTIWNILMDFYLVFLMEICPKCCQPDVHSAYFARINNQGVEDSNNLSSHLLQDGLTWYVIC